MVNLSEALYIMEIKSLDVIESACEKWMMCLRLNGGDISQTAERFKEDIKSIVAEYNEKHIICGKLHLEMKRFFKNNPEERAKSNDKEDF